MSIDTDVPDHGRPAQVRASLSEEFTVQSARLREFTQLDADTGDPGEAFQRAALQAVTRRALEQITGALHRITEGTYGPLREMRQLDPGRAPGGAATRPVLRVLPATTPRVDLPEAWSPIVGNQHRLFFLRPLILHTRRPSHNDESPYQLRPAGGSPRRLRRSGACPKAPARTAANRSPGPAPFRAPRHPLRPPRATPSGNPGERELRLAGTAACRASSQPVSPSPQPAPRHPSHSRKIHDTITRIAPETASASSVGRSADFSNVGALRWLAVAVAW